MRVVKFEDLGDYETGLVDRAKQPGSSSFKIAQKFLLKGGRALSGWKTSTSSFSNCGKSKLWSM
jgi:hypothetical protein